MKELIKESVKMTAENVSEEEKLRIEDVLTKVCEQNMSPAEAMGFDKAFFESIYAHAYNLFQTGNYKKAGDVYRILMVVEPRDPRHVMGLASCLHHLKEYKEAAPFFIQSGMMEETNFIPYYHAADCFKQMKNLVGEAVMLQTALEKLGDGPQYKLLKEQITHSIEELKVKLAEEKKMLLGK